MGRTSNQEWFRRAYSVITLLFFFGTTSFGKSNVTTPKDEVVVFVLDSFFEEEESHGDLVAQLIEKSCRSPIRLEREDIVLVRGGREFGYLTRLNDVLNYVQAHPKERIVVNISLGSYNYDAEEHSVITKLHNAGVVIVAAAGNSNSSRKEYPAAYPEVIAVGAVNSAGYKEDYSNYGSYIDLAAEGRGRTKVKIESKQQGIMVETTSTLFIRAGTSFASARVTGLVADVLSRRPDLSSREVLGILQNTGNPSYFGDDIAVTTVSRINPIAALSFVDPVFKERYEWKKASEKTVKTVLLVCGFIFTVSTVPLGLRAAKKQKIASEIWEMVCAQRRLAEIEQGTRQLQFEKIIFQTKFTPTQLDLADFDSLQYRLAQLTKERGLYEAVLETAKTNLHKLGLDDSKINELLAKVKNRL